MGDVSFERGYYFCRFCKESALPFDKWAGVCKRHLTHGARRLACLAASSWSFDQSSESLREFCGLSISDQTIRRVSEEEGKAARDWLSDSFEATTPLREAQGQAEVYADGVMVNTREDGWREARVSVFAKRVPGEGVDPESLTGLTDRNLPKPAAKLATLRIASCEQMGPHWKTIAARCGWGEGEQVSALGDGAPWLWSQMASALPRAQCVLDPFHVSEHVHACAALLYGEKTPAGRSWAEETMRTPLRHGGRACLAELRSQAERAQSPRDRKAVESLIGYLEPNVARLDYPERIRKGLPIGSGQVEGAGKTIAGRRLKINSARWRIESVQDIGGLCCLRYSDLWKKYWDKVAA